MNVVHFVSPFSINMVSLFSMIMIMACFRSKFRERDGFFTPLHFQFVQHKQQVTGTMMIIILSLPRLIFAFVLDCMKSPHDSVSLFLVGYFLSFIPPALTFVIFVLPSKTYMKCFKSNLYTFRNKIC
jgi:hypothetical protein